MRKGLMALWVLLTACQLPDSSVLQHALPEAAEQSFAWNLPSGFPEPFVPADNPMSAAKVELGRHLFYDTRLSADGSLSCASCHEQKRAFSDGRKRSIGVHGEPTPRNSMSLSNVAYSSVLTWANPHMTRLETQMLTPMFGEAPAELGLSGQEDTLLERLGSVPLYQRLFKAAYGESTVSLQRITQSIASFERTLISANSPYDRYQRGEMEALSPEALRGETLFLSEKLECFHCHGGFHFSDSSHHAGSAFLEYNFHNTGLYNLSQGRYPFPNTGLHELTHRPGDMGKFKAPTLRNIAYTAPYMHDGSVDTLDEVLDHYAAGGRSLESGPHAGVGANNPNKSGFVQGFTLSAQERADLKAFLHALSDESFLSDPALSDPFQAESAAARWEPEKLNSIGP